MQASTCCRGEFPSPQSIVHTYDDHQNPCQQGRAHCQFSLPLPCLVFPLLVPTNKQDLSLPAEQICPSPVLVSRRSRHHEIPKKHAMFSQSVTDSEPANEHCRHCHVRKAHVSSPARQSRFCRRSQPRHPLYQPYRVHEEGPIVFFESWWWLALYACVCMT